MNHGAEQTPERHFPRRGQVKLASFGAAGFLVAALLVAISLARYPVQWPQARSAHAVVTITEMTRPPLERETPPPPRPRRIEEPSAPVVAPPPAVLSQAPVAPPVITNPVWRTRPRNPERFYPREAFMQGIGGEVVLDCVVETNGQLECAIASETPAEQGFGAAALAIAAAHTMEPATQNGVPVRAGYRMIVPFSTGD